MDETAHLTPPDGEDQSASDERGSENWNERTTDEEDPYDEVRAQLVAEITEKRGGEGGGEGGEEDLENLYDEILPKARGMSQSSQLSDGVVEEGK